MHKNAITNMIRLAHEVKGPIAKAVKGSTVEGGVEAAALKAAIEEAGFHVVETGKKVLTAVQVFDGPAKGKKGDRGDAAGALVAYGMAGDAGEALLTAVHGWLKEEAGRQGVEAFPGQGVPAEKAQGARSK
jgi:hypothetical protein